MSRMRGKSFLECRICKSRAKLYITLVGGKGRVFRFREYYYMPS